MKIQWVSDDGHGWLQLPKNEYEMSILSGGKKASQYSYEDEENVYLEEDMDASEFLRWALEVGSVCHTQTEVLFKGKPIPHHRVNGLSSIRNKDRIGELSDLSSS
jgi:hypothetical protein